MSNKLSIFIDESGDLGVNISKGSSKIFVITAIVFSKSSEMDNMNTLVNKIKDKHNLINKEIKFNKTNTKFKKYIISKILKEKFLIYYFSWTKCSDSIKLKYLDALSQLLNQFGKNDANIVIDGNLPKNEQKIVKKELRKKISLKINKLTFKNSKSDNLLQVADLMSGLIYKILQKDREYKCFSKILDKKIRRF
jgi:cytochrome oxidase Cu insertion factor (SCO1/SenC/PrrC family)